VWLIKPAADEIKCVLTLFASRSTFFLPTYSLPLLIKTDNNNNNNNNNLYTVKPLDHSPFSLPLLPLALPTHTAAPGGSNHDRPKKMSRWASSTPPPAPSPSLQGK